METSRERKSGKCYRNSDLITTKTGYEQEGNKENECSGDGGDGSIDRSRNDNHQNESDNDDYHDDSESDSDGSDDDDDDSNRSTIEVGVAASRASYSTNGTIALFGTYSSTGNHFLRLALDAGYSVRAFLLPSATVRVDSGTATTKIITASALREEFIEQPALKWIPSKRLDDPTAIQRTLKGADYVVCMLADTVYCDDNSQDNTKRRVSTGSNNKKHRYIGPLANFIQTLYPLMKDVQSIQAFLYQATSLAPDVRNGVTPVLSKVMKTVAHYGSTKQSSFLKDQDEVMEVIAFHHYDCSSKGGVEAHTKNSRRSSVSTRNSTISNTSANVKITDTCSNKRNTARQVEPLRTEPQATFSYVVTRPNAFMKDGPPIRKLAASKSQPGPFVAITHNDLAEFTLNSLLTKKLFNSCPYVVPK